MEWGKRGDPGGEMATPAASKVVLKSTTKLSLNERFTNMLKNKQMIPANIRATMQQQHLASARNRRLAQQMESRPSVQAALKLKQSLKQRLGKSNIQARLGRPVGNLQRGGVGGMRGGGIGMRGSQRGMMRAGRGGRGMPRGTMSMRGQNLRGRGGSPRMGMGMRRGGGLRGRGMAGRGLRGGVMNRGGPGGRGRGGVVARGRGGFSRGRGRSRGRGSPRPALTREQLDNQLDAYMSKTKGHLDAELDAYMAQADPETND